MTYVIRDERDLIDAIAEVNAGTWKESQVPRFDKWPRYEIILKGERFEGGIPTRVMPAFITLQRTINRGYARCVYGSDRRLTKQEKKQIEVIVYTMSGSSGFQAELAKILNNAITEGLNKMTGTQVVTVIGGVLAAGAIWSGTVVWKYNARQMTERLRIEQLTEVEQLRLDHQLSMSQEETNRMQAILEMMGQNRLVGPHLADKREEQKVIFKSMEDGDQLIVGGEPVVDGRTAYLITRKPREARTSDRRDGNFVILSVDSGKIRDGLRVQIRHVETGEELLVLIPDGTLADDQIIELQDGEWGKRPLYMEVNVDQVGDRVVEATLVQVGPAESAE